MIGLAPSDIDHKRREKGAVVGDALEMLFKQLRRSGERAPTGARDR